MQAWKQYLFAGTWFLFPSNGILAVFGTESITGRAHKAATNCADDPCKTTRANGALCFFVFAAADR